MSSSRSCPACTLICIDASRRTCELCGCELGNSGFLRRLSGNACIDLDAGDEGSDCEPTPTAVRVCGTCTLRCDDASQQFCEACNSELPQKNSNSELPQKKTKVSEMATEPAPEPSKPRPGNSKIASFFRPKAASTPGVQHKMTSAGSSMPSEPPPLPAPAEAPPSLSWTTSEAAAELAKPSSEYSPHRLAWTAGGAVPYRHLAAALDALESTKSRLAKEAILTNAFRSMLELSASAAEVEAACYLFAPAKDAQTGGHRLRPDWSEGGKPLSIPRGSITAAIIESTGASKADLNRLYSQLHEIGEVAMALRERGGRQKLLRAPAPLTAGVVRSVLLGLADLSGTGVEKVKTQRLLGLLRAAQGSELKWLVRTFLPHMAAGISLEASVLPALGAAVVFGASAEAVRAAQEEVRTGYALRPDVGALVTALLKGGVEAMRSSCTLHLGVPMQPMLAKACTSIPELLKRIAGAMPSSKASGPVRLAAEFKYDGQRAQIHRLVSGEVKLFSRKMDDMTYKYPDVVAAIFRCAKTSEAFVVDAEIVAVVPKAGKEAADEEVSKTEIAAFQSLSTRKRKHVTEANAASTSVAVKLFLFDLLFLGQEVLLQRPFEERRTAMRELFVPEADVLAFAEGVDVDSSSGPLIEEALRRSVAGSCEGLMVKRLDSPCEPSTKRSDCWLKLKKDYLENMGDSLDLIPIGGWRGSGRKSRWVSPWLLATFDPEEGTLGSVCRVMSGFSDQFYKENTIRYLGQEMQVRKAGEVEEVEEQPEEGSGEGSEVEDPDGDEEVDVKSSGGLLLSRAAPGVETAEQPQFWFQPSEVWEIRGADITISPKHMSAKGLVDPKRGLSIRFPRFMRKREDKRLADATTPQQLAELFQKQTQQR